MTDTADQPVRARLAPWPHDSGFASHTDGAPAHPNVGRMAIYQAGQYAASRMPAVILGQRGEIVDLLVFSYHGAIVQEGAIMQDRPAVLEDGDNRCWLK